MDELALIAELRSELTRAAWRIQYRDRRRSKREQPLPAREPPVEGDSDRALSGMFVRQALLTIPQAAGRAVMEKLIIEGKTEKEASQELGISQQAVSKWKRKAAMIMRSQPDAFWQ